MTTKPSLARELRIDVGSRRPAALFRLLVASSLAGSPVAPEASIRAARAVFDAGWRNPDTLAATTPARRARVLRAAGYPRFVDRAARSLGDLARTVRDRYGGDLRRLLDEAGGDGEEARALLRALPGIGPVAAEIFMRDVERASVRR